MADLLIIVPSRGRPEAIKDFYYNWSLVTADSADLLVAIDEDDPKVDDYLSLGWTTGTPTLRVGPRLRLGPTLNAVAKENLSSYKYLGFMGDDHRPRTPGWDNLYCESLQTNKFVYGNDLFQGENLPTQVAMHSSVIKSLGYMCPPTLVHMYLDDAWKAWGYGIGSMEYLPEVIIEHLHPAAGKGTTDSHYLEVWDHMEPDRIRWEAYKEAQLFQDIQKLRDHD